MRYGDDGTLVLLQVGLQPLDGFRVEVVGRLVEQQHVRFAQQQAAEGHATTLSPAQGSDGGVRIGALQRIHRALQLGIDVPAARVFDGVGQFALTLDQAVHLLVRHRLAELQADFVVFGEHIHHLLYPFLNHLQDRFGRVELRFLLQIPYGVARSEDHLASGRCLDARDNLHHGGFSGTVQTDDTDLGSVEEGEVDILEDDFVVVRQNLAHTVHRKDDLFVGHNCSVLFDETPLTKGEDDEVGGLFAAVFSGG